MKIQNETFFGDFQSTKVKRMYFFFQIRLKEPNNTLLQSGVPHFLMLMFGVSLAYDNDLASIMISVRNFFSKVPSALSAWVALFVTA